MALDALAVGRRDVWHERLLPTRDYAAFCDTDFGRFFHHMPPEE